MLDIKFIRENVGAIKENCKKRQVKIDIDRLVTVDEERRSLISQLDELRANRKKQSKSKPTPEQIEQMKGVGEEIKILELKLDEIEKEFKEVLVSVPNLTHPDTPVGGEEDYRILYTNKEPDQFSFAPKDHETLLTERGFIDFERGAKVAGSKFYFVKNDLVRLNMALIQYGMDIATEHGFSLMETPDVAKHEIMNGTGYQPRGPEAQIYSIENTDLSLIATAEIPVGGYHADEILDFSEGPKKYAALSHSFRVEGGAYGRTSKGLYRVHQFTKLELFIFCKPAESDDLHGELLAIEKEICDGLEFPYRVIDIASGDLGGPAYRKYDIEAWMTMKGNEKEQGGYGEITSTSNCTDYQARRLNIRYRKDDGTTEFVHTLNGTAIALSRLPIAVVENLQQEDGVIAIPKKLQKYIGKKVI